MNNISNASSDTAIRIERYFDATPERVFKAFTDPAHLSRWWGPEGYSCPVCEVGATKGGAWKTTMRSPEGTDHTVSGVYLDLVEFDKIAFTWAWAQEDGSRGHETEVTIYLTANGAGTDMIFTHQIFQDSEARDNHFGGWTSSFDCLGGFLKAD